MAISGIIGQFQQVGGALQQAAGGGGGNFSAQLEQAISSVDDAQHIADSKLQGVASGENADLHGLMISMEQADISLRTMVTVRDKVVDAYERLINMAI